MDIFEFSSFHEFLKNHLTRQPKKGHGQQKQIAEAAGMSPAFLSQVLSHKRQLSMEQASLIADHLQLSELQTEYFLLLVEIDRAGNQSLKKNLQKQKDRLLKNSQQIANRFQSTTDIAEADKPIYYSDWQYAAVQQLTAIEKYSDVYKIAERLQLPVKRVRSILDFLLKTGLCVEKNGALGIGPSRIHLSNDSTWIKQHHFNWRQQAMRAFDYGGSENLNYSSPMTLSEKDLEKVRNVLVATIEKVAAVVDPSPSEQLACLNIDWFIVGKE